MPILQAVIGVGLSLLGGKAAKVVSKNRGSFVHEWAAPTAAAGVGTLYGVLTGDMENVSTVSESVVSGCFGYGGGAVLAHSILYGARKAQKKVRSK